MSGSPIVRDGKLIGAVTHVLVKDPTTGYGIIFENMLDTFEEPTDQAFLAAKGVKAVYAVNYNTKDRETVKQILSELYDVFGGFMASDTEDLEPIFEVYEYDDFN